VFSIFAFSVPVKAKLAGSTAAALVAVEEVLDNSSDIAAWVDTGLNTAALGLLVYILKLMFNGELVSTSLIESVVDQAVRKSLEGVAERDR